MTFSSMAGKLVAPTLPTHGYATVYFYPTISPRIVVIPIVSCIIGFPIFILLLICALRNRARKERLKAKRRRAHFEHTITELVPHTVFNQSRYFNQRVVRTKDGKRKTIVRFKPMPELDLDTVVEEKSEFDDEVNTAELLNAIQEDKQMQLENHRASFRSYRYGYGASGQKLNTSKPEELHNIHEEPPCDDLKEEEGSTPISLKSTTLSTCSPFYSSTDLDVKQISTSCLSILRSPVKCHVREISSKRVPYVVNVRRSSSHRRELSFKRLSKSCEEIEPRTIGRYSHGAFLRDELPKELTILRNFQHSTSATTVVQPTSRFRTQSDDSLVSSIVRKYENLASNERLNKCFLST